ncbi:hypothetical protein PWT90_10857 [Aphanocladium album]|nr:hypothetical protein PWT90_10857 [Aphanocladium album]
MDRWEARSSNYSLPQADSKYITLPSIRQAIPELHLSTNPKRRECFKSYHYPQSLVRPGPACSSEHIHSPANKKRRISTDEESDPHSHHYFSPERPVSGYISAISRRPTTANDAWRNQAPTYYKPGVFVSPEFTHHEHPFSLHGLPPPPGLECSREDRYSDEYTAHQRVQGPDLPNLSPFAPSRHGMPHQDSGHCSSKGTIGMEGHAKQRKRGRKLPKEATDKLRSWLVANMHLQYPTEDEKKELMGQTGLQMNQISNWFINARRYINNPALKAKSNQLIRSHAENTVPVPHG